MSEYVPGACNIGREEIERRRRAAIAGLVVTVLLAAVLFAVGADRAWRLTLFFPASVAAGSALQVRYGFCVDYGMRGRYNLGPIGPVRRVERVEDRAADRRKALSIAGAGAVIALVFTLAAVALP